MFRLNQKDRIYICSPLSAPDWSGIERNMVNAMRYCEIVAKAFHCRTIAPHSFLPLHLDDNVPEERQIALEFGLSVLKICKAMIVCGGRISDGMRGEIECAEQMGLDVYYLVEDKEGAGIIKKTKGKEARVLEMQNS